MEWPLSSYQYSSFTQTFIREIEDFLRFIFRLKVDWNEWMAFCKCMSCVSETMKAIAKSNVFMTKHAFKKYITKNEEQETYAQ